MEKSHPDHVSHTTNKSAAACGPMAERQMGVWWKGVALVCLAFCAFLCNTESLDDARWCDRSEAVQASFCGVYGDTSSPCDAARREHTARCTTADVLMQDVAKSSKTREVESDAREDALENKL